MPASPSRLAAAARWSLIALCGLALLGLVALAGLYVTFTGHLDPRLDLVAVNRAPSVSFLDDAGHVIASRGPAFGERLKLSEMPEHLRHAFLAAEDRRFYSHPGLDPIGLTRAMVRNVAAGRFEQGGSTITQQLARSLFLSNDRTLMRKVEEMFIAFWLEAHFTKDQILEAYLNRIFLGGGAYGVDAAARRYFGVSAREVTLAQAAVLAAMTRAPSRLAPTSDLGGVRMRAALVLDAMIDSGMLTHGEAYAARAVPAGPGTELADISFNYFADAAAEEVSALGIPLDQDLIVTTTIDRRLQRAAQETLQTTLADKGATKGVGQGAIVVIATDGAVKAVVGGADYLDSPFNRATQARRQPGSAFKAFVYLTALEQGLSPGTMRWDEPVDIDGWRPANFGGTYQGPVTLEEAYAKSINTVAALLGQEVGTHNVMRTARRLGLEATLADNRSLALGTSEVTLLDLTGAYLPFATTGRSARRHLVLEVKRADGEILYAHEAAPSEQLVAERIAREMNYMMSRVVVRGTARGAAIRGRPTAGKTGTSQDHRDAWFVGYTPQFVTGVWIGNDDNSPMDKVVGGNLPAQMFRAVMTRAHEGLPVREIPGGEDWAPPPPAQAWDDGGWESGRWPADPYGPSGPRDPVYRSSRPPPRPAPPPQDFGDALLDFLFGPPPPPPPPRRPYPR